VAKGVSSVHATMRITFIAAAVHPIRPTVLIYNCTWVCDARCEMCNNWKHGDRKADMTLAQLEPAMAHRFWGAVENLNISGGEPTTRNDLPEIGRIRFLGQDMVMRKFNVIPAIEDTDGDWEEMPWLGG